MGLNIVLARYDLTTDPKYPFLVEEPDFDSIRHHGDAEFMDILLRKDGFVMPEWETISIVLRPKDFGKTRDLVRKHPLCSERHLAILNALEKDDSLWIHRC